MNNLGTFLGGAVAQRNTAVQQGFQERALNLQENQMRASEQQAQVQSIRENAANIGESLRQAREQGADVSQSLAAADAQIRESVQFLSQSNPQAARSIATEWEAVRMAIEAMPSAEDAARRSGELSAVTSVANRDALVAAGAPDPWAPTETIPASQMFDERGNINPTTQRLIQSQVGALYGATFDASGNFVIPGDEAQLQEALAVQAEASRLVEAMRGEILPAEATIIAQRNIRSRPARNVGITGGDASGDPGVSADNPLPMPATQAEAVVDRFYRLRDGRIGRWTGSGFEVQ